MNLRDKVIVLLLLERGIRRSECVALLELSGMPAPYQVRKARWRAPCALCQKDIVTGAREVLYKGRRAHFKCVIRAAAGNGGQAA